jgi:Ca2+-binding EF-hand superfamily protein
MEEMLTSQNEKLDETLKKLSRLQQTSQQPTEPLKPWHGMSIAEINAIKLPLDITTWRTAHVQAWLSLKLDLPQYIQAFHDSSIDGLVLLKHIDSDILEETVGISAPLHRLKILEGIESLRKRQSDYESKKKASQKPPPEPPVAEDKPKKTEKQRKPKPRASQTIFGDVKEHNELEKIRLERVMKEQRRKEKQRRKKVDEQHELWKFEYTGATAPKSPEGQDGISEVLHGKAPAAGSSSKYEKMMKSIFETTDLLPSGDNPAPPQNANSLKLRQIPLDSPYDEVLTITRAAMFEVSNRLLKIYRIEKLKELRQNTDLEPTVQAAGSRYGDDLIEKTMRGTQATAAPGVDDESLPPPLYTEEEEETEGDDAEAPSYDQTEHLGDSQSQMQTMIPPISRSQLIFSAFINQRNNDARWLGPNSKLTRLKFHGGFESVLRLKIHWPQFDALWTKLDYRRSGELDEEEFTTFFGDFEEFESSPSPSSASFRGLSTSRPQAAVVDQLTALMYEICNIFRQNHFTIAEIFKSFDRNGSGAISISEFHSFLRVILGTGAGVGSVQDFYRMFAYLDRDNSRTISCQEIFMFVYLVWRSQLKDLAYRISTLDVDIPEDRALIDKILRERNQIKDAVKKNFSREWRDYYERMNQEEACSQGPFGHILRRLGVTVKDNTATPTASQFQDEQTHRDPHPPSPLRRSSSRPTSAGASRVSSKTAPSGKNELLKYRIQQSSRAQQIPTRKGAVLTVPVTHTLGGGGELFAEGSAMRFLQQTNPAGNQVFAMTSQL